jgi:hypothetical protein
MQESNNIMTRFKDFGFSGEIGYTVVGFIGEIDCAANSTTFLKSKFRKSEKRLKRASILKGSTWYRYPHIF